MKRFAVTLLALALTAALPLAAQETPPPQTPVEPAAQTPARTDTAPDAQNLPGDRMSPEMQAMMDAWQKTSTPGPQHAQLAEHFAGTWDAQVTMWMDPSAPPMTSAGRDVTTPAFGGRHLLTDFSSSMMGQPFSGKATVSYDNTTGQYVSHWIDSMSTGQFMATGDYDPATQTYTFTGDMPDPMDPGSMIPIREVTRITGPDSHVMEWYETRDGAEHKSMEIRYTRAADAPAMPRQPAPPPEPTPPPTSDRDG